VGAHVTCIGRRKERARFAEAVGEALFQNRSNLI
jgi:hypothetical protein